MAKTLCKHKKLGFSELDEKELLGKEKKEEGDERVTQLFWKKKWKKLLQEDSKPWAEYRWHSGSGENIKSLTSKV